MREQRSAHEIGQKIRAVTTAQTENFRRLIELAGLDPTRDLRFHDWTGVSFADQDLRGFDFTGARFVHCDFNNALIEGARFDKAVLDTTERLRRTDLSKAKDWRIHKRTWRRAEQPVADGHLRPGLVFQDAPMAPKMVPIPPGEVVEINSSTRSRSARLKQEPSNAEDTTTHIVPQPIAVSELTVTQSEYNNSVSGARGVMRDLLNFSLYEPKGTAKVAEHQARSYVAWLKNVTGLPYRLLTKSEWNYCCAPLNSDTNLARSGNRNFVSRCNALGLIFNDNQGDWCDGDRVVVYQLNDHELFWGGAAGFRVARDLFF